MSFLSVDLETDGEKVYGRMGNPFYNKIVAIGYCNKTVLAADYVYPDLMSKNSKLCETLEKHKITTMIGFNFKFDLLHLWKFEGIQDWLKAGGKVFDCQYAEYLLSGQQKKYPALRDTCVNGYGIEERDKYMEAYWEKGFLTHQIPKEIVFKDVMNDVQDTEKLAFKQVEKAKNLGMWELLQSQMDAVLATTEMEYNGIYVNKEILERNKQELQQQLDEVDRELNELCKDYWI